MIASRSLADLLPEVRVKANSLISACLKEGIELLVYSTYRDFDSQFGLYRIGRRGVKGEAIQTNAEPGESWHNWRRAFDVVIMKHGKCMWGYSTKEQKDLYNKVGAIGEKLGLQWSGRWKGKLREVYHFQLTGGETLTELLRKNPGGL